MNQFEHQFSAHCETGVTSALLKEKQIDVTEPMSLGIGSGLFFIFLPMVKVMGNPMVSYRSIPGSIFKKVNKRLNIKYSSETFRSNQAKGQQRLDELVQQQKPIGVQANIYWLKYIPENFRFHFNAHNLIVVGSDEHTYKVSDPLLEEYADCDKRILTKARFSKGPLAPKGFLYYIDEVKPGKQDFAPAIYKGINETVKRMLYAPVPQVGVKGIKLLGKHVSRWADKLPMETAVNYLSSVVRMQEEIGTGGAGFRYIYASFLDQAAEKTGNETLNEASVQMEKVADEWRAFAARAVKACRQQSVSQFKEVSQNLVAISEMEKQVLLFLKKRYL